MLYTLQHRSSITLLLHTRSSFALAPRRPYDIVLGKRKPILSIVYQLMRFHVLQVGRADERADGRAGGWVGSVLVGEHLARLCL